MKPNIFLFVFLLIINKVNPYLKEEERNELISNLAIEISEENINQLYEDKNNLYKEGKFQKNDYDLKEILKLMEKYNLSQN